MHQEGARRAGFALLPLRIRSRRIAFAAAWAAVTRTVAFAVYRPCVSGAKWAIDRAYGTSTLRRRSFRPTRVSRSSTSTSGKSLCHRAVAVALANPIASSRSRACASGGFGGCARRHLCPARSLKRKSQFRLRNLRDRVCERPGRRACPSRLRLYLRFYCRPRGHQFRLPHRPADPHPGGTTIDSPVFSTSAANLQSATAGAGPAGVFRVCQCVRQMPTARCGVRPRDVLIPRGALPTRASRY